MNVLDQKDVPVSIRDILAWLRLDPPANNCTCRCGNHHIIPFDTTANSVETTVTMLYKAGYLSRVQQYTAILVKIPDHPNGRKHMATTKIYKYCINHLGPWSSHGTS